MIKRLLIPIVLLSSSLVFSKAIDSNLGTVEIIDSSKLLKVLSEVLVIDARQTHFNDGHIPNSQNMDWENWTEEKPSFTNAFLGDSSKWGRTLAENTIQNRLRQLGLSHSKLIVVVGAGKSSWGEEGRVAWNLLYWGAKHVALLDGGYPDWLNKGYPIQKGPAISTKPGDFIFLLKPQRRASKDDIKENLKLGLRSLFDIRSLKEFNGQTMPGQRRGGHIPKARLVEFNKLYQDNGRFINAEDLKRLIGTEVKDNSITYCTGGVRSALFALLLEAKLGILTANYDASIWEWSNDDKLPIEKEKSK